MGNERSVAKQKELISASIDELYTDNSSNDGSICTNSLEEIRDGNCVHPDIITGYIRL